MNDTEIFLLEDIIAHQIVNVKLLETQVAWPEQRLLLVVR
jgi:hypothetical protein